MNSQQLAYLYLSIKHIVTTKGYGDEIEWYEVESKKNVRENDCMREAAWVILSAGMSFKVVGAKFSDISIAFRGWNSSVEILNNREECYGQALEVFNHSKKISAILAFVEYIAKTGVESFLQSLDFLGTKAIVQLPYIGPATGLHLMKNLGFDVAKPDRHLVRIAKALHFESVDKLCRDISIVTGDTVSTVDTVFWRFAEFQKDYIEIFDKEFLACISKIINDQDSHLQISERIEYMYA